LDEYALALLVRSRELSGAQAATGEDFEFVLPQSRGLVRCLGAEAPAELRPLLRGVERRLPDVARLSAAQLEVELERTRLTMRKRALLERKAQLALLIRDTTDDGEHLELARTMSELAQAIEAIERQLQGSQPGSLPEREQVGLR
jgi:hypothetical protein